MKKSVILYEDIILHPLQQFNLKSNTCLNSFRLEAS